MGTETLNLNYNIFAKENKGIRKYIYLCCLGKRTKLQRVKRNTQLERIKLLRAAEGKELLRAYHLSLFEYDENDPEKAFEYNAVREEILRRL